MGIAQDINLDEAESFAAPEHLVSHFNAGTIDYEQMAVLSAKHYLNEHDALVASLDEARLTITNMQLSLSNAATDKATLTAKLAKHENQDLALAMARSELVGLTARIANVDATEAANVAFALKVESLTEKLALQTEQVEQNSILKLELAALDNAHAQLTAQHVESQSKNNKLNSLAIAHEKNVTDLKNDISVATRKADTLTATITDLKGEVKGEKQTVTELRQIIKDNLDSVEEAKLAVSAIASTLLKLDKNQKALDKENRLLSLYVNAHTTAPIFETPEGHQLKALMYDKNQIVSNEGKEAIAGNSALFQWVNPNGFSCLIALSGSGHNKDDLLLMPTLVDESIAGKLTPTGKKVAKNLTDAIAPPKEYYDAITNHIREFKVDDFKKAMLKAFARANFLTKQTEHLLIEAEDGMTAGDIQAMREMSLSHDRTITRNIARSKAAMRAKANPHKKAGKTKKRR